MDLWKKTGALLLASVLLGSALVGCGKKPDPADSSSTSTSDVRPTETLPVGPAISDTDGTDTSTQPSQTGETAPGKTTAAGTTKRTGPLYAGLDGTTVTIPLFAEPDDLTKKQIEAFQAKYKAKIKYDVYGWQEYQARLLVMVNSSTAPDITPVFDQQYLMYVGKNIIQPIEPYINKNDTAWDSKLNDLYKWGGKQYTVSTSSDLGVFGIYYNKDLFEEYEVDDPYELYQAGKWDFDAFRKAAKQLTVEEDGSRLITGFYSWKWDILVMANGGQGIRLGDNKTIQITLDEPRELKAFELIQDMQLEDKSYDYAYQSADSYFKAGRIAMISERPGYSEQYHKGKFKVGWVPLPKGPDVKEEIAPCIVGAWGVPRGAKNGEGGVAWIYSKELYRQQNQNSALYQKGEDKIWPDKTLKARYDAYVAKAKLHTSLIGGCNNWDKSTRWGFWEEIFVKNTPPSTAVAKHKAELQHEIDQINK